MQTHQWTWTVVAGLLMICAGAQTGSTSEPSAAVAPTGKLRVAFLLGPIYATKDSATGELKGVAIDLGEELARRIGVPFEPVTYASVPEVIGGAKTGVWDVALTGINPERAAAMDFSPPYMDVEQGYLVRAGVPIATESDVDKAEIRVGVSRNPVPTACCPGRSRMRRWSALQTGQSSMPCWTRERWM